LSRQGRALAVPAKADFAVEILMQALRLFAAGSVSERVFFRAKNAEFSRLTSEIPSTASL